MVNNSQSRVLIEMIEGRIKTTFTVLTTTKTQGDMISCWIPGFDLYFSSPQSNPDELEKRGKAMVGSFYEFFLKKLGSKQFFLELHKLGFRTENHNFVLKELLNSKSNNAKFEANYAPKNDFMGQVQHLEEEYAG